MKSPVICTILAKNYLAQGRCLIDSFRQQHRWGQAYVLIVDTFDGYIDREQENFTIVTIDDLNIPQWWEMVSRYTTTELCTAVKPFFLQYLFQKYELPRLCYFDPDIYFYAPLHEIWKKLETHPIVLTPHLLGPVDESRVPNEFTILQSGIFNLGFIGLQRTPVTDSFLRWWQQRCQRYSYNAPHRMQHYDQRWIDFVPGFIDEVAINRQPGANAAYWDLSNRQLTLTNDKFLVNGMPLIFFHFSGYSPDRPESISRYQNRFTFADFPVLKSLFDNYSFQLRQHGYDTTKNWPVDIRSGHPQAQARGVPTTMYRQRKRMYEGIQDIRPQLYRRLTQTLARYGLELFLTRLLGERSISQIRALAIPAFRSPRLPFSPASNYHGLNLIGFFEHNGSIGEIARRTDAALRAVPYPINQISVDSSHLKSTNSSISARSYYRVNLIHANADVLPQVLRQLPAELLQNSHITAYWTWELPTFPKEWQDRFTMINEVWVCSHFVKQALESVASIPIHVMGAPVEVVPTPLMSRHALGLPNNKFIFLFIFDAQSYLERKNPYAVIEAFRRAFGERSREAHLVIKVHNLHYYSQATHALREAVEGVCGTLIDETYSSKQLSRLLMVCDSYVSLHRAEGFGLSIAEAMMCAKPVIATGYSGNMDYMTEHNSFAVSFKLVPLTHDIGPYAAGQFWAEPDIDHAAQLMRIVLQNPEEATRRGTQAQFDIEHRYSLAAFAEKIIQRLSDLPEHRLVAHQALKERAERTRILPPL